MKTIKNNIHLYFVALTVLVLVESCRKLDTVVDLKIDEKQNLLVVNSIFTNDSIITVDISKTSNYFSTQTNDSISGAICQLYINGTYSETLLDKGNGTYTTTLKAVAGNSYELKVSANGFKSVTAQTQLPSLTVLVDAQTYADSVNGKFNFTVKDIDNSRNYYTISLLLVPKDSLGNYNVLKKGQILSLNQQKQSNNQEAFFDLFGNSSQEYSAWNYEFDDEMYNQQQLTYSLNYTEFYYVDSNETIPLLKRFVYLKNVSAEMYNYKKTLQKQQDNANNAFAEPVQIYNNITGGLGIFAGYSQVIREVKRK